MTQPRDWGASPAQKKAVTLLAGPQRHTLLVGGSRSRKTFTFVRATCVRAIRGPGSRHLIARYRANAAHASIALDTFPKVMRTCFPEVPYRWRHEGYFELPGERSIWVSGLDDKERVEKILGNEYATIFLNECSQIVYPTVVTVRTRLAQVVAGLKQRMYYDLNPVGKAHWSSQQFIHLVDPVTKLPLSNPDQYKHMFLNPKDNPTLDPNYLAELESLPERQRRRFLLGEYVEEVEGALWTYEIIEQHRVAEYPAMRRIVVIVDPSGASSSEDYNADEIGIAVVGLGIDNDAYVLEDRSLRAAPAVWGKAVVKAYRDWEADTIIAEQNFGGEMVRFVIQAADRNVPVRVITASRGKVVRAEPVSAMYEKGRVHHVGRFPALEDQLCAFSTMGYTGMDSPDRADAVIWGVTELILPSKPGAAHIIEHYKREAALPVAKQPRRLVPTDAIKAAEAKAPPMAAIAAAQDGNMTNKVFDLRHRPAAPSAESPPGGQLKARPAGPAKKYNSFTEAMEDQT